MSLHERITEKLKEKKIKYKETRHEPVRTSEEAAKVRGSSLNEGAKALIFRTDVEPVLIVIPANLRVDKEKFKQKFGFKKLKMVAPEEVKAIAGVEPGGVPPFGGVFDKPLNIYAEIRLFKNKEIEFNAGDRSISIRMKSEDWAIVANPKVGEFAEASPDQEISDELAKIAEQVKQKKEKQSQLKNPPLKPGTAAIRRHQKSFPVREFLWILAVMITGTAIVAALMFTPAAPGQRTDSTDANGKDIAANAAEKTPSGPQVAGAETGPEDEQPFVAPYTTPPPEVSAKAFGVFNVNKSQRMYAKNPDLLLPPASVTKIMTALVAMDKYPLDKVVTVPESCTKLDAAKVGFKPGEQFKLEDMLYGLLVPSGADAACAIAKIDDEAQFIEAMNQKASNLGMTNTKFENEIGFDATDSQLTTVDDLEKLATYALKSREFSKIVGTQTTTLYALDAKVPHKISTTNDLLNSIPGTVGIKTGYTSEALECLAYLYSDNDKEIMIIILGSQDRFGDTNTLLEWAKQQINSVQDIGE